MANVQPNRFVLQSSDGRVKVDYETTSLVGQPVLNLTQGSGPTRHFAGSQVRRVNTEIGTLVTVTTQITVDTGSTSFSVLIPAISLNSTSDRQSFTTDAILTSHTGPISVPPTGVHERYQFITLQGQASFVSALVAPLMTAAAQTGTA